MKNLLFITLISFCLIGCSGLSNCSELDELAQSGVCADPFYINKNIKNIDTVSYPNFDNKDGRFIPKEQ
ncbi:MAG: hypothetical protein PHE67_04170 [Campylobacterales bacterium]|nr:hypothetical protein [Campylobacterales bacterium]